MATLNKFWEVNQKKLMCDNMQFEWCFITSLANLINTNYKHHNI